MMKTVGIREIKNDFSAYVRAARNGEIVTITDRGQVVARLVSPETPIAEEHPLAEMSRRGEITLGKRLSKEEKTKLYSRQGPPLLKGITSAEILDALREDVI